MTPSTPNQSGPAKPEHSALPWRAMLHEDPAWKICHGNSNFSIVAITSQRNDQANAELIVRAVNNHASLVAALERTTKRVESLLRDKLYRAEAENVEHAIATHPDVIEARTAIRNATK